jgi:hypothetical protein
MPTNLLRLSVLLVVLVGAGNKKIARGPCYPLGPVPELQPGARPLLVKIDDGRPEWQQHYYLGTSTPATYAHALTFVPMENLQPPPVLHLLRAIENESRQLPVPLVSAQIAIRSFRVVISRVDELEAAYRRWQPPPPPPSPPPPVKTPWELELEAESRRMQHEIHELQYQQMVDKAKRRGKPIPSKPDCECDDDDDLFEITIDLSDLFAEESHEDGHRPEKEDYVPPIPCRKNERYLLGPPRELDTSRYGFGVTCRIRAVITLYGANGYVRELNLRALAHVPPSADSLRKVQFDQEIRTAVHEAVTGLAQNLVMQLNGTP